MGDTELHPTASRSSLALRYLLLVAIAAAVVAVDQVTKTLAVDRLADGPVDVVHGILTMRLTLNSGGAFGILQGLPGVFVAASLAVVALVFFWVRRLARPALVVPLGLMLGGGLGNVADRLFRDLNGKVVDFIDLHVWPVFNVADACIVTGIALLLFTSLVHPSRE
ncbi:MAG: signal peptidase II [Actinomycetota bacterium]|nr:signal peptidase II [Actinomycetota bacterium]